MSFLTAASVLSSSPPLCHSWLLLLCYPAYLLYVILDCCSCAVQRISSLSFFTAASVLFSLPPLCHSWLLLLCCPAYLLSFIRDCCSCVVQLTSSLSFVTAASVILSSTFPLRPYHNVTLRRLGSSRRFWAMDLKELQKSSWLLMVNFIVWLWLEWESFSLWPQCRIESVQGCRCWLPRAQTAKSWS